MVDPAGILDGLVLLFDWRVIAIMVLGLVFGIVTGAIPGFSTPLAISIMLPLTFPMSPLVAIVFLTAIYAGGNFGSSISAILLNIPGSPQAIVTGLDGNPMTKQGKANEALGIAVAASASGNLIGSFFLIMMMPVIVTFALMFGPPELFLVGVLGLTVIAALHRSFLKALIAGMFGVLLGTVGMTSTGSIRGTHGFFELMDGIPVIPALIGLIGFSELFYMLQKAYVSGGGGARADSSSSLKKLLAGYRETFRYPVNILRSSAIGVLIGALPGAGATVGSVVSYNEAKRYSRDPDKFGKGSTEGLLSAEAANNASEGGALATMLSLGIPGGLATAVLIGAFLLQGLVPGPRLFIDNQTLVYGVMLAQFFTSALLLIVGLAISFYAARIINIPTMVMIPVIAVFSVTGTYAINQLMFDVQVMLVFAVLGIILRRYDYPLIAVILGIILGPILDRQLIRTYQGVGRLDIGIFLGRPVSVFLIVLLLLSLTPLFMRFLYRPLFSRGRRPDSPG
jgi:putative tricarboxylic transport membrane protein